LSEETLNLPANTRENNFGLLRVLLALLVIVSHAPEQIDGSRSREILTCIFGTLSFGELAVDGFFLISGYLITKSIFERPILSEYLIKRAARIMPGFLVSFWLCYLVVAPCAGAGRFAFTPNQILTNVIRCLLFFPPIALGAFHNLPYPYLNGSMWTIFFEAECYLAIALVGFFAIRIRYIGVHFRWILLGIVLFGIYLFIITNNLYCRFDSIFGVGALFYLFRDLIPLTAFGAAVSTVLMSVLLFNRHTAEAAVAILGGYLIFWFALKYKPLKISAIASHNDISYGLYLYAWPIGNLILWNFRTVSPIVLGFFTILGAGLAGYISWHVIEKRFLAYAHSYSKRSGHCSS
jgi:peptidoglycan/LPS O-acetylase OafA/YrhL